MGILRKSDGKKGSVETLHIFLNKKEGICRQEGFHTLTAPPPIIYSLTGFNWDIQGNFGSIETLVSNENPLFFQESVNRVNDAFKL